tara:strand:- start:9860 stop:10384 length:525 start_codon:yes stop_codon:yes gene_type:complete
MTKIVLKNVRLSFASLFRKATFGGEETKYEGTFLIDKVEQADQIKLIEKVISELQKEKKIKLLPDKICLKDGDFIDYDGYAGTMSIKASNSRRPMLLDKDRTALMEDDGKPYSGCYVNAVINLWFQDNSWGKRINASLTGVQFASDGKPFGENSSSASIDDFSDLEETEEVDFL